MRFLFYLNENPKVHRLFLLGDIFDAWVSDGSSFIDQYQPVIAQIAQFKNAGGEVYYFEGNHDVHIDVYWTKKFNIPVIEDFEYFDLGGLTVRAEHGDYINPDDIVYLKYLELIHRPWVEFTIHRIPSRFWKWLTESYSQKSRKKTSRYTSENVEKIRKQIRQYAEKSFQEKPFDLIVTGHMHVFDDYEFSVAGKKVRSINLGTWLDKPRVLKLENGKIEIVELNSSLE